MNELPFEQQFVDAEAIAWETVGEGVRRKILTYDANLMMVVVDFEQGGVGALHKHYHTQISYVKSGAFAITIGDDERVLKAGDAYYIPPNVLHGAVCQEAGMLVDVFTPMREDFVQE